jgi:hypothetical protein
MEKARWIVERGLHRPPEYEIEVLSSLRIPS